MGSNFFCSLLQVLDMIVSEITTYIYNDEHILPNKDENRPDER
jgi:hypothetical protein